MGPGFAMRVGEGILFTARACIPYSGALLEAQRSQRKCSFTWLGDAPKKMRDDRVDLI